MIRIYLPLLLLSISTWACQVNPRPATVEQEESVFHFEAQDTTWKSMSVREKIGQTMLMLPNHREELRLGNGRLEGFFQRYPVGGFFMGWKLFDGVSEAEKLAFIKQRSLEYAEASSFPLLFQQDYEYGVDLPGMTPMPVEMALGAANSEKLAYDYGKAVAQEARSVGVSWVLHPVADLNQNPFNSITNIRSISDDPDKAIRLLGQQIAGLQGQGVAATIKHFPGDGVDFRNQHLLTSCNSLSMEQWQANHGKVFQALINQGVAAIMPGHITLPAYQQERFKGMYLPATLSKELLTDLLKGEMNFNGVIVSDAMVMAGFRGWYDDNLEAEIQSFLAGVDMMLWPSYAFMDTVEARILSGEIPMERLDDAVSRVWAMKERFGILDPQRPILQPLPEGQEDAAEGVARAVSEAALTLVKDLSQRLPLDTTQIKKILLVGVAPVAHKGGDAQLRGLEYAIKAFEAEGFEVDFQHNLLYEDNYWTESVSDQYDQILFLLARAPHTPFGPLQFFDNEAQSIWGINAMPKDKIIVIAYGDPYAADIYFERVPVYINAYSNSPMTHEAVVKALLGEIPFKGTSPVDLESVRRFR